MASIAQRRLSHAGIVITTHHAAADLTIRLRVAIFAADGAGAHTMAAMLIVIAAMLMAVATLTDGAHIIITIAAAVQAATKSRKNLIKKINKEGRTAAFLIE